jgi:hypothetical protein
LLALAMGSWQAGKEGWLVRRDPPLTATSLYSAGDVRDEDIWVGEHCERRFADGAGCWAAGLIVLGR